jgi:hypothetical protein
MLVAGLAYSFPLDVAFLMAVDLGTWIEAAVAVYVVSNVTRIRPILAFIRARQSVFRRRSRREVRTPAVSRRRESSNDDDPAPSLAFAA